MTVENQPTNWNRAPIPLCVKWNRQEELCSHHDPPPLYRQHPGRLGSGGEHWLYQGGPFLPQYWVLSSHPWSISFPCRSWFVVINSQFTFITLFFLCQTYAYSSQKIDNTMKHLVPSHIILKVGIRPRIQEVLDNIKAAFLCRKKKGCSLSLSSQISSRYYYFTTLFLP